MNEPNPPLWVSKRDGSQAAFDADRISRALFAAGEALGRPDAFEARELTDSVVHFLAHDCDGPTTTTIRIAEVVEQVVRELGRPDLARAFAEYTPSRTVHETSATLLMERSRQTAGAYSRDLEAARASGLLILPGSEAELLAGGVLGPPEKDLLSDLQSFRGRIGRWVAMDGLEDRVSMGVPAGELVHQLARGLAQTKLAATINLNLPAPSWAGPIATGPLFAGSDPATDPRRRQELSEELLEEVAPRLARDFRDASINWHLGAADFEDDKKDRFLRVLERARSLGSWTFTLDRRRPLVLGLGLDRQHPAVLFEVGLNLPELARQPGLLADPERFCLRLGTLVRLALSAARQKQMFVRQAHFRRPAIDPTGEVTRGFLLDRARLVVVPVGLDEVVTQFTGWSMTTGGVSLDFGRRVVRHLREILQQDGPRVQLENGCLDGPVGFSLSGEGDPRCANVAGLTPWDAQASLRRQVQAATALWTGADAGVLALFVSPQTSWAQLRETLAELWRQSSVSRVRLFHSP